MGTSKITLESGNQQTRCHKKFPLFENINGKNAHTRSSVALGDLIPTKKRN